LARIPTKEDADAVLNGQPGESLVKIAGED